MTHQELIQELLQDDKIKDIVESWKEGDYDRDNQGDHPYEDFINKLEDVLNQLDKDSDLIGDIYICPDNQEIIPEITNPDNISIIMEIGYPCYNGNLYLDYDD